MYTAWTKGITYPFVKLFIGMTFGFITQHDMIKYLLKLTSEYIALGMIRVIVEDITWAFVRLSIGMESWVMVIHVLSRPLTIHSIV